MLKRLLCMMLVTGMLMGVTGQLALAGGLDDRQALAGVSTGRALFDVNIADAGKLILYLKVIRETREGLLRQQVTPDFIVAFRGPAVQLVADRQQRNKELTEAWQLIGELKKGGVRFEACGVATRLFGVENGSIIPEVSVVGNTFISSIGYQTKGYALIPIM